MEIRTEIPERECHFENCVHYADRECLDLESRQYCLEIAFAVLCVDKEPEIERGLQKSVCDNGNIT